MTLDYFYGNQSEQFTFYRIPKLLFTDPELKNISTEAKVLYGLLLDRMSLSIKNNWLDEQRRVFIIFTIDEIMEALACAEQKAAKLLNELEKGVGLIERKRQGLGKPNLIYVKNFVDKSTVPVRPYIESQILNCENHNSGSAIITDQELPESQTNNTEIACQVSMVSQNALFQACKKSSFQVAFRLTKLICSHFSVILYMDFCTHRAA